MNGTHTPGSTTERASLSSTTEAGGAPPQPPRPKRAPTAGDLIRSLLVIIVPLLIITWIFTRTPDQPVVKAVNWQPVYTTAQKSAPYPLLAPTQLPAGWKPTRVQWTLQGDSDDAGNLSAGNAWTLGFLSPQQIYFAVRQTDGPSAAFIAQVTRKANPDGTSVVDGTTWTRYVTDDGRTRALVLRKAKVTSVVVADAPYTALESFTARLHG